MKTLQRFCIVSAVIISAGLLTASSCKKPVEPPPPEPPAPLTCELNISGGCFDQWVSVSYESYDYSWMEPAGDFLRTLNELYALPPILGGPGPITTDSTRDCYAGTHAAKLVTAIFTPQVGHDILIPGLVGATTLDIGKQTIYIGKPYSSKPLAIQGWYKYFPVSGDSSMVEVQLHRYNAALGKRDTIAWVQQKYKGVTASYTKFELPLVYYDNNATPDSISLLIVSSAGIDFSSLQNCKGQPGSTMFVDEISFIMP